MPTNRLGSGTANVPINWLNEEREVIGRLASAADQSFGSFVRTLVVERLQQVHPDAALKIVSVRSERRLTRLRITLSLSQCPPPSSNPSGFP